MKGMTMGRDLGDRRVAKGPVVRRLMVTGGLLMALLAGGCAVLDSVAGKKKDDSGEDIAPKSQRISILELEPKLEPDPRIADLEVTVPPAVVNANWSQPGGSAQNHFAHLALPEIGSDDKARPKTVWSIRAGRGSSKDSPLTAPPIVADGRVFVLDSRVTIRGFDRKDGAEIWERELTPEGEKPRVGFGGGLAYGDGRLYGVTGFGQVVALDPSTGESLWERRIPVPIHTAPTFSGGRIYVTSTDNQLLAYDAATGKSVWSERAMTEAAGILSAVSPAVGNGLVIAPFSSGEIVAYREQNGREIWADTLVRTRKATAMAGITDIAARPVIHEGRAYGVSHSGRMVAIDLRTGERVWDKNIAAVQTPWVAGEFLFMVTVDSELLCISTRDGRIRWLTRLKRYKDPKDRDDPIFWMGPLLLSDRLLMVNSLGEMAFVSPKNGQVLVAFEGPGEMFIPPVAADGTIYLLTDEARLTAMR